MNRHYQYISPIWVLLVLAIISSPAWSQPSESIQPRKGDAELLRPAQGLPISPTNINQFLIERDTRNTNLNIQNTNLKVDTVQPIVPGNYNASPQKVNRSGNFSSDPLNAVQIFQETSTPRRNSN